MKTLFIYLLTWCQLQISTHWNGLTHNTITHRSFQLKVVFTSQKINGFQQQKSNKNWTCCLYFYWIWLKTSVQVPLNQWKQQTELGHWCLLFWEYQRGARIKIRTILSLSSFDEWNSMSRLGCVFSPPTRREHPNSLWRSATTTKDEWWGKNESPFVLGQTGQWHCNLQSNLFVVFNARKLNF